MLWLGTDSWPWPVDNRLYIMGSDQVMRHGHLRAKYRQEQQQEKTK